MGKPILGVNGLHVGFRLPTGDGRYVEIIHDLSLSLARGDLLGIIGESGSGKSVLASAITRVLPNNATVDGQVRLSGNLISELTEKQMVSIRGRRIGYAFQSPGTALNPLQSVGRQIMEPLLYSGGAGPSKEGYASIGRRAAREKALSRLTALGFDDPVRVFESYPHELSGGMQQRVVIAIASILDPAVLILDEPTKGLDGVAIDRVMGEIIALRTRWDMGVLCITHDVAMVGRVATHIGVMYAGELVEYGPAVDFFRSPLHPYSQGLLGSLPENGFKPIPGEPLSRRRSGSGCRFHPRCASAVSGCPRNRPHEVVADGRMVRCRLYE